MASPHMIRRRMAATTPLVLALLLLTFVLVAFSLGDRAIARMAAETLIRVTLVVGFWIFVGNSGVVSFGHAAFACIGAYVSAWATLKPEMKATLLPGLPDAITAAHWHVLPAAVAGGLVAALGGAALAFSLPHLPWLGARIDRRDHAAGMQRVGLRRRRDGEELLDRTLPRVSHQSPCLALPFQRIHRACLRLPH